MRIGLQLKMYLLSRFLFTASFFWLAFLCWLLGWPTADHPTPLTRRPPHECRCWFCLFDSCCAPCPDSASWWEQRDYCYHCHSLSWRGSSLWLFACCSFKDHQHHLPGVHQMQVSSCLLCTTCPLQKDLWKKTTKKWTVRASHHPPMPGPEVTVLWDCLSEKWFLSWHLGMWKANKCSCCFSAS